MAESRKQPNVLLICTDHWGGRFLGCDGHPVVMTPTIDQLARSGTRFDCAYSACPTCIPARRTLMTGMTARSHGDRTFNERLRMPDAPTMAQCFRDAGYQAYAVGKLHVYPQRNRIGFDDVILNEEGRHHLEGLADDWELYLQEQGYTGQEYASGLCNNDFVTRAWHLPEHCHPTNWAAREMNKVMHRRDRDKPAFWYLSFVGPHQPVWPLQTYVDMYNHASIDKPVFGDWSQNYEDLPYLPHNLNQRFAISHGNDLAVELARRHFYATITHIDHQIRTVIGYLREQGELENTIIAFTADHGEMLGDHGMWTKTVMYDGSNRIPLVISLPEGDDRLPRASVDSRIAEIGDIMPTLLELAGIDVPDTVECRSLLSDDKREYLYGDKSTRMIRTDAHKLIYYAAGNQFQLFDMQNDPRETNDLADDPSYADITANLTEALISELYGEDLQWVKDGKLVGLPLPESETVVDRGLAGQRGYRFVGLCSKTFDMK